MTGAMSKDVYIRRHTKCAACSGSGIKSGTQPRRCKECRGAGSIVFKQGQHGPLSHNIDTIFMQACSIWSKHAHHVMDLAKPQLLVASAQGQEPNLKMQLSPSPYQPVRLSLNLMTYDFLLGVDNGTTVRVAEQG
jgi:hypothetical protein